MSIVSSGQIWRTYGISTPIIEIWAEVTDDDSSE